MAFSGWSDTVFVEHGSAAALDDMAFGTLAFWCYTTSSTARQVLWSKNTDGGFGANSFTLAEQATPSIFEWQKIRATTSNAISAPVANFAAYAINKWIFVAVTFDTATDGNNKIYVGDLTTAAAEPSAYTATPSAGSGAIRSDSTNNWRIGRHATATGRQFVGSIACQYLYSQVLTAGQIWELQFKGIVRSATATALISTQYGFAAGGATALQPDWTGSGNNGSVSGTPTVAAHVPIGPLFGTDFPIDVWTAAATGWGPLLGFERNRLVYAA